MSSVKGLMWGTPTYIRIAEQAKNKANSEHLSQSLKDLMMEIVGEDKLIINTKVRHDLNVVKEYIEDLLGS